MFDYGNMNIPTVTGHMGDAGFYDPDCLDLAAFAARASHRSAE